MVVGNYLMQSLHQLGSYSEKEKHNIQAKPPFRNGQSNAMYRNFKSEGSQSPVTINDGYFSEYIQPEMAVKHRDARHAANVIIADDCENVIFAAKCNNCREINIKEKCSKNRRL